MLTVYCKIDVVRPLKENTDTWKTMLLKQTPEIYM